jgi:hypothetical protein
MLKSDEISQLEAAGLLGVGERTFRHWCGPNRETGFFGPEARPYRGRSNLCDWAIEVEALDRGRYAGFTGKKWRYRSSERITHEIEQADLLEEELGAGEAQDLTLVDVWKPTDPTHQRTKPELEPFIDYLSWHDMSHEDEADIACMCNAAGGNLYQLGEDVSGVLAEP